MTFRDHIEQQLTKQKMSVSDLAKQSGCKYPVLYAFLRKKQKTIPTEVAEKLLKTFGEALPEGVDNPPSNSRAPKDRLASMLRQPYINLADGGRLYVNIKGTGFF